MRIAFLGSTQPATIVLSALAGEHDVAVVVTQEPKVRGSQTTSTPVYDRAKELGIEIIHNANDATNFNAEIAVVAAYGALIREPLLSALPILNVHPSLLPRWRGAAPMERAILAGDHETGVCIMQIVKELDAGPVYARETVPLGSSDYADQMYDRMFARGSEMLLELLKSPLPAPVEQTGEPTYAEKFSREHFRIDWNGAAEYAHRHVRCNRAWTTSGGEDFRIHRAELVSETGKPGSVAGDLVYCVDGALRLIEVQPAGKRRMSAEEWLRGVSGPIEFI